MMMAFPPLYVSTGLIHLLIQLFCTPCSLVFVESICRYLFGIALTLLGITGSVVVDAQSTGKGGNTEKDDWASYFHPNTYTKPMFRTFSSATKREKEELTHPFLDEANAEALEWPLGENFVAALEKGYLPDDKEDEHRDALLSSTDVSLVNGLQFKETVEDLVEAYHRDKYAEGFADLLLEHAFSPHHGRHSKDQRVQMARYKQKSRFFAKLKDCIRKKPTGLEDVDDCADKFNSQFFSHDLLWDHGDYPVAILGASGGHLANRLSKGLTNSSVLSFVWDTVTTREDDVSADDDFVLGTRAWKSHSAFPRKQTFEETRFLSAAEAHWMLSESNGLKNNPILEVLPTDEFFTRLALTEMSIGSVIIPDLSSIILDRLPEELEQAVSICLTTGRYLFIPSSLPDSPFFSYWESVDELLNKASNHAGLYIRKRKLEKGKAWTWAGNDNTHKPGSEQDESPSVYVVTVQTEDEYLAEENTYAEVDDEFSSLKGKEDTSNAFADNQGASKQESSNFYGAALSKPAVKEKETDDELYLTFWQSMIVLGCNRYQRNLYIPVNVAVPSGGKWGKIIHGARKCPSGLVLLREDCGKEKPFTESKESTCESLLEHYAAWKITTSGIPLRVLYDLGLTVDSSTLIFLQLLSHQSFDDQAYKAVDCLSDDVIVFGASLVNGSFGADSRLGVTEDSFESEDTVKEVRSNKFGGIGESYVGTVGRVSAENNVRSSKDPWSSLASETHKGKLLVDSATDNDDSSQNIAAPSKYRMDTIQEDHTSAYESSKEEGLISSRYAASQRRTGEDDYTRKMTNSYSSGIQDASKLNQQGPGSGLLSDTPTGEAGKSLVGEASSVSSGTSTKFEPQRETPPLVNQYDTLHAAKSERREENDNKLSNNQGESYPGGASGMGKDSMPNTYKPTGQVGEDSRRTWQSAQDSIENSNLRSPSVDSMRNNNGKKTDSSAGFENPQLKREGSTEPENNDVSSTTSGSNPEYPSARFENPQMKQQGSAESYASKSNDVSSTKSERNQEYSSASFEHAQLKRKESSESLSSKNNDDSPTKSGSDPESSEKYQSADSVRKTVGGSGINDLATASGKEGGSDDSSSRSSLRGSSTSSGTRQMLSMGDVGTRVLFGELAHLEEEEKRKIGFESLRSNIDSGQSTFIEEILLKGAISSTRQDMWDDVTPTEFSESVESVYTRNLPKGIAHGTEGSFHEIGSIETKRLWKLLRSNIAVTTTSPILLSGKSISLLGIKLGRYKPKSPVVYATGNVKSALYSWELSKSLGIRNVFICNGTIDQPLVDSLLKIPDPFGMQIVDHSVFDETLLGGGLNDVEEYLAMHLHLAESSMLFLPHWENLVSTVLFHRLIKWKSSFSSQVNRNSVHSIKGRLMTQGILSLQSSSDTTDAELSMLSTLDRIKEDESMLRRFIQEMEALENRYSLPSEHLYDVSCLRDEYRSAGSCRKDISAEVQRSWSVNFVRRVLSNSGSLQDLEIIESIDAAPASKNIGSIVVVSSKPTRHLQLRYPAPLNLPDCELSDYTNCKGPVKYLMRSFGARSGISLHTLLTLNVIPESRSDLFYLYLSFPMDSVLRKAEGVGMKYTRISLHDLKEAEEQAKVSGSLDESLLFTPWAIRLHISSGFPKLQLTLVPTQTKKQISAALDNILKRISRTLETSIPSMMTVLNYGEVRDLDRTLRASLESVGSVDTERGGGIRARLTAAADRWRALNSELYMSDTYTANKQGTFSFMDAFSGIGETTLPVAAHYPDATVISVGASKTMSDILLAHVLHYKLQNVAVCHRDVDSDMFRKLLASPEFLRYLAVSRPLENLLLKHGEEGLRDLFSFAFGAAASSFARLPDSTLLSLGFTTLFQTYSSGTKCAPMTNCRDPFDERIWKASYHPRPLFYASERRLLHFFTRKTSSHFMSHLSYPVLLEDEQSVGSLLAKERSRDTQGSSILPPFLGIGSGWVRLDATNITREVNHHFESELDGHKRTYVLRVETNATGVKHVEKQLGQALPSFLSEPEKLYKHLVPGNHPNNGGVVSVRLVRDEDKATIPYVTVNAVTLISTLRLGLVAPLRRRAYRKFVEMPLYIDMAPWNIVLIVSRNTLFV